jgi:hypothetical protein
MHRTRRTAGTAAAQNRTSPAACWPSAPLNVDDVIRNATALVHVAQMRRRRQKPSTSSHAALHRRQTSAQMRQCSWWAACRVAFLGAGDARRRAGLDHCADEADVGTALPGCDARGRVADVRASRATRIPPRHGSRLSPSTHSPTGQRKPAKGATPPGQEPIRDHDPRHPRNASSSRSSSSAGSLSTPR